MVEAPSEVALVAARPGTTEDRNHAAWHGLEPLEKSPLRVS